MTVTMYGWLLFSVIAVVVLVWFLNRRSVDQASAQAEWCYDIALLGFDKARELRVGSWCECSVPVPWLDANVRFCCKECGRDVDPEAMELEEMYRSDWVAFDGMRDDADTAGELMTEAYVEAAEDAAQEAFERRLRAEANTQSEF